LTSFNAVHDGLAGKQITFLVKLLILPLQLFRRDFFFEEAAGDFSTIRITFRNPDFER